MAEFEASLVIDRPAADVFDFAAQVGNLPTFLPTTTVAEPAGPDRIHVAGDTPGGHYDTEGLFRARPEQLRLEWGSDGTDDYSGWLQVFDSGPAGAARSEVTLHLSFRDEGSQPTDAKKPRNRRSARPAQAAAGSLTSDLQQADDRDALAVHFDAAVLEGEPRRRGQHHLERRALHRHLLPVRAEVARHRQIAATHGEPPRLLVVVAADRLAGPVQARLPPPKLQQLAVPRQEVGVLVPARLAPVEAGAAEGLYVLRVGHVLLCPAVGGEFRAPAPPDGPAEVGSVVGEELPRRRAPHSSPMNSIGVNGEVSISAAPTRSSPGDSAAERRSPLGAVADLVVVLQVADEAAVRHAGRPAAP